MGKRRGRGDSSISNVSRSAAAILGASRKKPLINSREEEEQAAIRTTKKKQRKKERKGTNICIKPPISDNYHKTSGLGGKGVVAILVTQDTPEKYIPPGYNNIKEEGENALLSREGRRGLTAKRI